MPRLIMNKLLSILVCSIYCCVNSACYATKGNFPLSHDGLTSELPKESLPEVAQVNQQLSLDEIEKKTHALLFKPNTRPKLGSDY